MKISVLAGAVALALGTTAISEAASAGSLTVFDLGLANPSVSAPLLGPGMTITGVNNAPVVSGGGQNFGTIIGSNGSNQFGNSVTYTDGSVGWSPWGNGSSSNQWLSIGGSGGGTFNGAGAASATFSLASPSKSFEFVWGSSSVTNTVTLYDGNGHVVGSVVADGNSNLSIYDAANVLTSVYSNGNLSNNSGPGAIIDITSNVAFKTAVLSTNSGTGGFEVGGLVSAVPLPAALPLFGTVVAGFAFYGRRRRKTA